MAINYINPGFMGLATIAGDTVRFSDASINARQEVNIPDLIMGDWDRDAYNYGPIEVGGSISGPADEDFSTTIWDWGVTREAPCGLLAPNDVDLQYYCGKNRNFTGMVVNSLTFSCSAGDIAQWSVDVMGITAAPWGSTQSTYTDTKKLLTWDQVNVSGVGSIGENEGISNFEFNVANNVEVVYSLGQEDLFPIQIVPGLRTITGSLSFYNIPEYDGADTWGDTGTSDGSQPYDIQFNIGAGVTITASVRFHRVEATSATGPIVSTVAFSGVGHQSF